MSDLIAQIARDGIGTLDLIRESRNVYRSSGDSEWSKKVVADLYARGVKLTMVGDRLMPFALHDRPAVVVPPMFIDPTMQFACHLEAEQSGLVYIPSLDSDPVLPEVFVKQGIWLRNFNGRFSFVLAQRSFGTPFCLDCSPRVGMLVPVVRLPTFSEPNSTCVTLLPMTFGELSSLRGPFAEYAVASSGPRSCSLQTVNGEHYARQTIRNVAQGFKQTHAAMRSLFDSAHNPIGRKDALELIRLLIATESMATVRPNRNVP